MIESSPKPVSAPGKNDIVVYDLVKALMVSGLLLTASAFGQDEDLRVLNRWANHADASNALYGHLSSQIFDLLGERAAQVAQLRSRQDWLDRQTQVQQTLLRLVGPFPARTALNPQITGVVQKEGFRLEKVIYESMPNFYVTAGLFIPDDITGRTPAILFCSGHSEAAFRRPLYQQVVLNCTVKISPGKRLSQ